MKPVSGSSGNKTAHEFMDTRLEELESLFIGKQIGVGMHRAVFLFLLDQTKIIKVANCEEGRQQNILDLRIWEGLKETQAKKWLAPIHALSPAGKYLIQDRVEPLPKQKYPKRIPDFFTDTKYTNFGWLKGKFVCCDFGAVRIFKDITLIRLVKANWWEN